MSILTDKLNSFSLLERKQALYELLKEHPDFEEEGSNVNLHFHTFNSYNCEGWSPTRIAYESKLRGLYAAGIIDFDVLDGSEEFLEASELLGLRASVGIETRAFHTEYAKLEIDSPCEPGVSYIAGAGFVTPQEEESPQSKTLAFYRRTSRERNLGLIKRINDKVPDISIDYIEDVLPLTPSGNATERHIIQGYIKKTLSSYPDKTKLCHLWGEILGKSEQEILNLFQNLPALEDMVRSKLAKKGGIGYVQPTSISFPKLEDFFTWVRSCSAIPLESWLDGTSQGEENGRALLELSKSKGAAGLNIIPDRNWNIKDPEIKARKYKKLKEIVAIAQNMDLPLHIGTEMNRQGLPFVDNLEGTDLKPFKNQFINGTKIFIGHAILQRFAHFSYCSDETDNYFNLNTKAKNDFFAAVGALPPVNRNVADNLRSAGMYKSFSLIQDALKVGKWR